MLTLDKLRNTLPQTGRLEWLATRPARGESMVVADQLVLDTTQGIIGDRYAGRSGERQVTLIQAEHLVVVANLTAPNGTPPGPIDPASLRRNLVVAGINLLALDKQIVRIGAAQLEVTGRCHPCSRMERVLGPGGYNAMRGHGGITARVVTGGTIKIGDTVALAAS